MPSPEKPSVEGTGYRPTRDRPENCLRVLATPVRFLKGIGPARAERLERLGLKSVEDLLYHLPFRYEDRRLIKEIRQATPGMEESFVGKLISLEKKYIPRRRRQMLLGTLADGTGVLGLVWYHVRPYIADGLEKGGTFLVHGKVERGIGAQLRIVHPQFELVEREQQDIEKIVPVYLKPGGIAAGSIRRWVAQALAEYGSFLPSFLPEPVIRRQKLMDLSSAIKVAHQPDREADPRPLNCFSSAAHRAIIFDEFFYLQLGLGMRKKTRSSLPGFAFGRNDERVTRRMREILPFKLTAGQERILLEIYQDMGSRQPMQRLIQGDVGSGKTIVAWLAALRAIENGFQAVWLAPTELLAEQHYRNLKPFADRLSLPSALLTGSLPAKAKKAITSEVEKGEIPFVVGTHALLQESVRVPRMGLGIIDEQHRFGVVQRMALHRLGEEGKSAHLSAPQPDMLLMSATPIPRSLAMVLYGDLEISFLDEMPPGRTPARTRVIGEKDRSAIYAAVREELVKGHQAYVVYPLVEASEQLQLRDATRMADELSRGPFRDFRLGLIHGRINAEERDRVMRRFKEGEVQILVATTVIEVGIDVPNATMMVVEHAERFGLSQLHQLRGRVGRGEHPSQCLLIDYGGKGTDAFKRLQVMEREQSGFRIAEEDLRLRGPGELLGTRQAGMADFRLANLVRDARLLLEARKEALEWLSRDPSLSSRESRSLRKILQHRWGGKLELGGIG